MANTFDDLQTLNAMFAQSLAPINRLGAGQVAIAQNALAQRQQIEEEARRNLFTQQLLNQQQQFTVSRDVAAERARMGLVDKTEAFQLQRDALQRQARAEEVANIFQQNQIGKELDVVRGLKAELEELGGTVPPEASTLEIRSAIQQRLGESVGGLMKQLDGITKELVDEGQLDPVQAEKRLTREIVSDPGFQSAAKDHPDVLKGLINGTLSLRDVPAALQKAAPYWSRSSHTLGVLSFDSDVDKKNRVNAFLEALVKAQNTVATQELQIGMDFKKSPQYLERLNKYKAINTQAHGLLQRLQNPDRIKEAMNFNPAVPATNAPGVAPTGRNFGLPPHIPARGVGASGQW